MIDGEGSSEGSSEGSTGTENPLGDAGTGSAGSEGTSAEGTSSEGTTTPPNALYGDLAVEWPEGTDEALKVAPALKPFVGKDGKINQAALLKSYHDTKKSYGADRVIMPGENSSDEEVQEFWNKAGASSDIAGYKQEVEEGSLLTAPFMESLEKFAHENKMPVAQLGKMAKFLEGQVGINNTAINEQQNTSLREGVESIKTEYGQAYDQKIEIAKKVIAEFADEKSMELFKDPTIGANPAVIKTLVAIGEKIYKEGSFGSSERASGAMTPMDTQEKINTIMGDRSHPYHNPSHPNHKIETDKMLKLYEMRG